MSEVSLTDREREVLRLIADGLSNREIAHELTLTLGTVKWYARQIYTRLGVSSRTQAAALARKMGLLDLTPEPLAPTPRPPHNLPAPTTSFIGREKEIDEIKQLIRVSRLLTLTGPPGTGKTRLAQQAAGQVLDDFTHGVLFVDLAPIKDPDLVLDTLIQTYNSARFANEPLARIPLTLESFKDRLHNKTILLVLDNFEHILDAANAVADLLATLPHLKVLATSREALHIYGEQEYYLSPLKLPAQGHTIPACELGQIEAVALFVQRAQAIQPDFILTEENAPAVMEICNHLDGLPLAIELAAARIKMFPPDQMLARLRHCLDLLTSGARDLPTRQQNLRATLDWSYDLLNEDEKLLLAGLSIFQGGRTIASVEAVCGPNLTGDVLVGLESLLNKNLLWAEEGSDGDRRFYFLETIHEYADERLATRTDAEPIRRRHAEYFIMLAERTRDELRSTGPGVWCRRLRPEIDNVRTALKWTLVDRADDYFQTGTRLTVALCDFWFYEGLVVEGRKWVDRALSYANLLPPARRVEILNAAGMLAYGQGDHLQGRQWNAEALALAEELGDNINKAWALVWLGGHSTGSPNQYKEGMRLCDRALACFRQEDDSFGLAWSLNMLGEFARLDGNYERAREVYEECLAVCRDVGAGYREALTRENLAIVELRRGNYDRAETLIMENLAQDTYSASKYQLAYSLAYLAGPVGAKGYHEPAARLIGASEALFESIEAGLYTSDKAVVNDIVKSVRNQLGPTAFEAARMAGRAMTPEKAVAYALSREWV